MVDLSSYRTMDPDMLVGVINTVIRNHCDSLEDLCATYDLDPAILIQRLAVAGYDYRPEIQQFR